MNHKSHHCVDRQWFHPPIWHYDSRHLGGFLPEKTIFGQEGVAEEQDPTWQNEHATEKKNLKIAIETKNSLENVLFR